VGTRFIGSEEEAGMTKSPETGASRIKRILIEFEDGQRMEISTAPPEPQARTQPPPTEWWRCPDCHCTGLVSGKYCHCQTGRDLMRVEGRASVAAAGVAPQKSADLTPDELNELDRLNSGFADSDYDELENRLRIYAAVRNWTGDPLQQQPRIVLGIAREVAARKSASPIQKQEDQCSPK
jgi:hypothetical protein